MSITTAFQGGFQMGFNATSSWKKRKEDKEAIDKALQKEQQLSIELSQGFDRDRADGVITQQEYEDRLAYWIPFGNEYMDRVTKLYDKTRKMTKEQRDAEIEELNSFIEIAKDNDYKDVNAFKEATSGFKSEKAINQANYYMKSIEDSTEDPKLERYATLKEFQDIYGETAAYEYDEEGYIRPKYVAPKDPKAMSDYQRKRQNIMSNKSITEDQRKAGIYKLDTGIDITPNDDEGDFTTTEGKRTADFAFTQLFGYTTPDGIKIAGIVPANLARVLSLGRKATDAEVEEIKFDWEARKNVVRKMGGSMAVDAIDTILNQLFRETKPEDVISDSLQDKAIKYIEKVFGGTNVPDKTKELPKVEYGSKTAMVPLMSKEEVKAAMESTDINDPLYKELYDRAVKEGWITE